MIYKKGTVIKRIAEHHPGIGFPLGSEFILREDFNTEGTSPLIFTYKDGSKRINFNIKAWNFLEVKTINLEDIYEQTF